MRKLLQTFKQAYTGSPGEPLRKTLELRIDELEKRRIEHRMLTIQHQAEVDCCVQTINLLQAELAQLQKLC